MKKFTFVDLFSGVGGFHLACASNGGVCLLACDIDPQARDVYKANYGIEPHHDIMKLEEIPKCDVLCSGFPCVAFSHIGRRKGTLDPRGRLFYRILKLIRRTPPKFLFFENVIGLLHQDNGKTFNKFLSYLKKCGYSVGWVKLDAADFGVPQHRERVYIIASLFSDVSEVITTVPQKKRVMFKSIQEKSSARVAHLLNHRFDKHILDTPISTGNDVLLRARLNNYINNKVYSTNGIVGTLCAGFTPIIYDEYNQIVRYMTHKEMLRCQGFPDDFKLNPNIGKTILGRFMGNAVCVPVVQQLLKHVILPNM